MKLAEALILRADYQKRLAQLRERIKANARVQEGESPAEEPQALIAETVRVGRGTSNAKPLCKYLQRGFLALHRAQWRFVGQFDGLVNLVQRQRAIDGVERDGIF